MHASSAGLAARGDRSETIYCPLPPAPSAAPATSTAAAPTFGQLQHQPLLPSLHSSPSAGVQPGSAAAVSLSSRASSRQERADTIFSPLPTPGEPLPSPTSGDPLPLISPALLHSPALLAAEASHVPGERGGTIYAPLAALSSRGVPSSASTASASSSVSASPSAALTPSSTQESSAVSLAGSASSSSSSSYSSAASAAPTSASGDAPNEPAAEPLSS